MRIVNRLILVLIISAIIVGLILISVYNNPEFRYYLGTTTGLKDKPVLTDENFMIEEVIVGIQSSTALTFIDDDILFLEKETGKRLRSSYSRSSPATSPGPARTSRKLERCWATTRRRRSPTGSGSSWNGTEKRIRTSARRPSASRGRRWSGG